LPARRHFGGTSPLMGDPYLFSSNSEELRPDLTILAKKDLLSKFLYSSSVNGSASIKLL
jgi:hypothetical protein